MDKILKSILVGFIFFGLISSRVCAEESMKEEKNVYSFTLNDIDGKPVNLSQYKGKILLIVNTASRCGYTSQYKSLQSLYEKYQDKGLVILGFPANNFNGQEPGTNEEIKNFCSLKFNVSFPMFSKISVKGDDIHPLYQYLTSQPAMEGPISWNFNKFLVDPQGQVIARYGSSADPLSDEIVRAIEKIF
jgi:glutathione peroxidase-family protein